MSDQAPDTDTGAAFAAGHATATAEQASADAATAEIKADIAGEQAEAAAAHAESAAEAAWATMAAVDELREDVMARLEQLQRPPAEEKTNPETGAEGGGAVAPAPERKEAEPKPAEAVAADKGDKPKRKHGAGWWFGS